MPIRDIARPRDELVSAEPDTPLSDLAQLMDDRRVGCVVIERENNPAGIVTDRDLALRVIGEKKDPDGLTASDIMTDDPHTAEADNGVFELCAKMREHGVRRLPVVEDGELIGIVTLDDMVVLLEDEMHDISEVIQEESPPYSA